MAKGAYIGADGVARKVKKCYIGVEERVQNIAYRGTIITENNVADYFDVVDTGSYGFAWSNGVYSSTSSSSTRSSETTWTAKQSIFDLSLDYVVGSKPTLNSAYLTITVAGIEVLNDSAAGSTGSWNGTIKSGETIVFAARNTSTACSISSLQATNQYIMGYEDKEIAHLIKKAYIGIGGVARPCWNFSGGELTSYGKLDTGLSKARQELASALAGNYLVFSAGTDSTYDCCKTVDAFNSALVRTIPTATGYAMDHCAGASVGNYACFVGNQDDNTDALNAAYAYDSSLTMKKLEKLTEHKHDCGGASVRNYALFAGGAAKGGGSMTTNATVNIVTYTSSLTQGSATLSQKRTQLSGVTFGEYALFGGGITSSTYLGTVDAFDSSLTRTTLSELSAVRSGLAACTNSEYALFGGGTISNQTVQDAVDAYNSSLTRTVAPALSVARKGLAATGIEGFGLFGGGEITSSKFSNVVDVYDSSLTRTTSTGLTNPYANNAAGTIGNYALFAGGRKSDDIKSVVQAVDAYTVV